jgi:hypothetical protein
MAVEVGVWVPLPSTFPADFERPVATVVASFAVDGATPPQYHTIP